MHPWEYIVSVVVMVILFAIGYALVLYLTAKTGKLNFSLWISCPILFTIAFSIAIGIYFALPFQLWCLMLICSDLGFFFGLMAGHANYRWKRRYKYGTADNLL